MSIPDSDDEGSLFGDSPPPTRASSPSLALPTAASTLGIPKEPQKTFAYAAYIPSGAQYPNYHSAPAPAAVPVPVTTRPKPPPTMSAPPPKKKQQQQKKEKREGQRLPPPQICLPDPDAPPPANFLRNQKALLGTAGLVGRVKPSKLSIERHSRGTTVANPINVDDENDAPSIPFRALPVSAFYPEPPKASAVTAPTNEEIVASLIRQKNIFPILQSLLQLLAKSEAPAGDEPAAKRQKTEGYHTNWEKQRGQQLIAQLVGLIKAAATRAAAKSYHDNRTTTKKEKASTPQPQYISRLDPVTGMYRTEYVVDYRTMYQQPTPSPLSSTQPSFDTLVASLLAGTPDGAPALTVTPPTEEEADKSMVQSWMDILQTFPTLTPDDPSSDSALRSAASTPTAIGSPFHSHASTPGPDGTEPTTKGAFLPSHFYCIHLFNQTTTNRS